MNQHFALNLALVGWCLTSSLVAVAQPAIFLTRSVSDVGSDAFKSASCLPSLYSMPYPANPAEHAAGLSLLGCFALTVEPTFALPAATPRSQLGDATVSDAAVSRCGAFCQQSTSMGGQNVSQFALSNDTCYCIAAASATPASLASSNLSASCCSSDGVACGGELNLRLFQLELNCPLSLTACELSGCRVSTAGCCVPASPPSTPSPAASIFLVIEVAVIALVVAAMLHFAYTMVFKRRRSRARQPRRAVHERRFLLPGGTVEDAVVMVGMAHLAVVAECCAEMYPDAEGLERDACCCICLESYEDVMLDALETPCKHSFHRWCMVDYLQHKIRTSLEDLTCPMCRAVIMCQVLDGESELGRLRESLFEMRTGRQRPAESPSRLMRRPHDVHAPTHHERGADMDTAMEMLSMTPPRPPRDRGDARDGGEPEPPAVVAAAPGAVPLRVGVASDAMQESTDTFPSHLSAASDVSGRGHATPPRDDVTLDEGGATSAPVQVGGDEAMSVAIALGPSPARSPARLTAPHHRDRGATRSSHLHAVLSNEAVTEEFDL